MLHDNFIKTAKQESHEFKALLNILSSLNLHTKEGIRGIKRNAIN